MMKAGRVATNAALLSRRENEKSLDLRTFENDVEKSRIPSLLIFTSPGCKPCQLMAADLEALEKEYHGRVAFFRICADNDMEIAAKLAVVSTPTLILFVDGKPAMRLLGYVTRTDISNSIEEQLKLI